MAEPPVRDPTSRRIGSVRPWLADAGLAVVVAGAQVAGSFAIAAHRARPVTASGLALLCVGASALVLRRRYPVAVLAVTYATTFAYLVTQVHTAPAWLAVVVAFVTAVQERKRAAALGFLVAGYVLFLWGPMLAGQHAPSATFAWALGTGLAALAGGSELLRQRRQRAAAVARSRREELLRHASDERLRIARELHDVVAHHISAIHVQANTALHLVDRQPDRTVAALATINDVSKQVLMELRAILGVLRGVDENAPRAPAPSVARLDDLVTSAAAAGVSVQLHEDGARPDLRPDVDLAAYRIVQEALTNTARHSGGYHADVRLAYLPKELLVEIADDGVRRVHLERHGAVGNGITGMVERARALGGTLTAAPGDGGGFVVRARLPLNGREA